ncbi:hypothetical protein STENM327S_03500 [Streptomyces tendae]
MRPPEPVAVRRGAGGRSTRQVAGSRARSAATSSGDGYRASGSWSWDQDPDARYPSPEEVAADLALDPATWRVERAAAPRRTATGPGGRTAEVVDHVLLVRRAG